MTGSAPTSPHDGMIWVIGLSRTGTTSLAHALCHLGYPNLHYPHASFILARNWAIFDGWKGGSDISVTAVYKQLDQDFPNSRFILTTRDPERWVRSVTDHFEKVPRDLDATHSGGIRRIVYGHARPTPEQFIKAWHAHLDDVRSYFRGREDYTEMDLSAGDGWDVLCPFLGVAVPDRPFPIANRADGNDSGGSTEAIRRHKELAIRLQRLAASSNPQSRKSA